MLHRHPPLRSPHAGSSTWHFFLHWHWVKASTGRESWGAGSSKIWTEYGIQYGHEWVPSGNTCFRRHWQMPALLLRHEDLLDMSPKDHTFAHGGKIWLHLFVPDCEKIEWSFPPFIWSSLETLLSRVSRVSSSFREEVTCLHSSQRSKGAHWGTSWAMQTKLIFDLVWDSHDHRKHHKSDQGGRNRWSITGSKVSGLAQVQLYCLFDATFCSNHHENPCICLHSRFG